MDKSPERRTGMRDELLVILVIAAGVPMGICAGTFLGVVGGGGVVHLVAQPAPDLGWLVALLFIPFASLFSLIGIVMGFVPGVVMWARLEKRRPQTAMSPPTEYATHRAFPMERIPQRVLAVLALGAIGVLTGGLIGEWVFQVCVLLFSDGGDLRELLLMAVGWLTWKIGPTTGAIGGILCGIVLCKRLWRPGNP